MVRESLAVIDPAHPVHGYLEIAPDVHFDAGLVDTFLHGRERSYTVDDCLELVAQSGLDFGGWFLESPYEPIAEPGEAFLAALAALPDEQRWATMERINTRNGCHFFTARRSGQGTPRPTLADPGAAEYVPAFRYRCGLEGAQAVRPGWRMDLRPMGLAVAEQIDGQSTIGQIAARAGIEESAVRAVLSLLKKRDVLALGLPHA